MESDSFQNALNSNVYGATIQNVASVKVLQSLKISLPSPLIQRQIIAQIEQEQALVNANKQLVEVFEQKIKDRIARVWGE
jgi:type I restriction enzyme M protein